MNSENAGAANGGTRSTAHAWPLLLALIAAAPLAARADDGAAPLPVIAVPSTGTPAAVKNDNSGDAASPELAEVIVTARKREERMQDVPISIAAFSGDQLDARGIVDVRDLGQLVPGLQFTDLAGYNLIYLRGVGTDAFVPSADPSIATYLDGVYFPSGHSIAQSFGALDRIEVLKGPQGTLFGRNSTGGAISVWTRDPGPLAETSVQASYARFDDRKLRVYTNLPLGDDVAASISAFYNRARNDYRLDNGTGDQLPPEIGKGVRLKLGFQPRDDLSVVLTGMLMRQSGTSTTTSANTDPSPILGASIPAETRDYVVTANSEPSLTTDTRAAYGIVNWDGVGVDVKLLGSYYWVNAHDYVYDFDGSQQPLATYGADSEYQRIVTSELQFTSDEHSWGASWLKWVGGFYYLNSRGGYDPGYLRLLDLVRLPAQDLIDALPPALGDAIRGPLGNLPLPESLTFYFTGLIGAESYSGYVQTTASLTDWLDLTVGGRYQHETRKLLRSDVGLDSVDGGLSTIVPWSPQSSSTDNFSPKISLDLRPAPDLLLYASAQRGFKSATYNIINIYTPPDYVKPERVTSYELGVKSQWFGRRLRINAAAFQNDIDDLQTGFVSFTSGGAINFENAGSARIRGFEFDTAWQVLPKLDPGLLLTAGGTWLDAKYTDYESGHGYSDTTGLAYKSDCRTASGAYDASLASCHDFTGNRIVRTPKFSGDFGISQSLEVPGGTLELAGDWYYNSGYYYLAQNSANSFEAAYDIINARLSYLYRRWGLRVTLFGENLGDERYDLAQFHTDFGREDTLAPPRTYGIRLNWDF